MANLGSVGTAFVQIEARTRKLDSDLKAVERKAETAGKRAGDRFAKAFSGRAAALKGAIAGFLSAAAVRSIVQNARRVTAEFDAIAKTADKIGLATDALQELRFAAELSGVGTQTLDMAMQRFTRRTAEAAQGTGVAKKALEELGVSVTDAAGRLKPADQLLAEVADAMGKIPSQADRVRLAFALFDSEGVALVNLLKAGSAGIEDMRQKARDLGIVIEEQLLRQSESLNDRLTEISKSIDADLSRALASLTPLIVDVAQLFADLSVRVGDAYQGMKLFLGLQSDVPQFRKLQIGEELEEIDRKIKEVEEGFVRFSRTGQRTGGIIPGLPGLSRPPSTEELNKELEATTNTILELQRKKIELQQELASLGGEDLVPPEAPIEPAAPATSTAVVGAKTAQEKVLEIESITASLRDRIAAEKEEIAVIQAEIEAVGQSALARELLVAQVRADALARKVLEAAARDGLDTTSAEVQEALKLVDALKEVTAARLRDTDVLEQQQEAAEEAAQRTQQMADQLQSMADRFIDAALNGGDLKEVLRSLSLELADMIFKAALFGPPGQSGGGLFGSLFTDLARGLGSLTGSTTSAAGGGGGSVGSFLGSIGSFIGSLLPGFQHGGAFRVGGAGGPDTQLVAFRATPGEVVTVGKDDERAPVLAPSVTVNLNVRDAAGAKEAAGSVAREVARQVRLAQKGYI